MSEPLYLTPAQLAQRWACHAGWLANERSAGRGIAYLKIGSKVLYSLAEIERHEAAATIQPLAVAA